MTTVDPEIVRLADASPNFGYLLSIEQLLVRYAVGAEAFVFQDTNISLVKMRQFLEVAEHEVAVRLGGQRLRGSLSDRVEALARRRVIPPEIKRLFDRIRLTGNGAVHAHLDDRREALACLQICHELGAWLFRTIGDPAQPGPGVFIPPAEPAGDAGGDSDGLREDLRRLQDELVQAQLESMTAEERAQLESRARAKAEADVAKVEEDLQAAFALAIEAERELGEARSAYEAKIAALYNATPPATAAVADRLIQRAVAASRRLRLSEAETRRLIDEQLRAAGWEADSDSIRFGNGTRPAAGRNLAIAEWPTASGPADYVLFIGTMPVGIVEAKPRARSISGELERCRRYARDFQVTTAMQEPGRWGEYRVPFLFATNGRPYLKQLETESGLWFLDCRRNLNQARARREWPGPDALSAALQTDVTSADDSVGHDDSFAPRLRRYQRDAVRAIESAITDGARELLVEMATGTGKTVTCLNLMYRMLKHDRFKRILFLVDRVPLGDQVKEKLESELMDGINTLSHVFEVNALGGWPLEHTTRVHVATVQSMARRLADHELGLARLDPDLYDCIVVDECHRGYTQDHEMSTVELEFRSDFEYLSKYRQVLDHFDAVRIGLTATPAAHTVEIFGPPIYSYPYRQAVIDGYLTDHEPPIRIETSLARLGIHYARGAQAQILDLESGNIALHELKDELDFDVDDFNRAVITPGFNRTVAQHLAQELAPGDARKTIVFCVSDKHADLFVDCMRKAFAETWGEVDPDTVLKITATAEQPAQLIRRFKNETLPSIAVTVDLLTTGIDVPAVTNLVFVRRVRSRILFEQMLGRATRLCPEVGKDLFRIFDAVDLYRALEPVTSMRSLTASPKIDSEQLLAEYLAVETPEQHVAVAQQLAARFQRQYRRLTEESADAFTQITGMTPDDFVEDVIRARDYDRLVRTFLDHPDLAVLVERGLALGVRQALVHEQDDHIVSVSRNYGAYDSAGEYLTAFTAYLAEQRSNIAALSTALTEPHSLTGEQLADLHHALAADSFTEATIRSAIAGSNYQDVDARLVGFVRHFALGLPLVPFATRVDRAASALAATSNPPLTGLQQNLLKNVCSSFKANSHIDRQILDDGQFRQTFGGFARMDRIFSGNLDAVLVELARQTWTDA